MLEFVILEVGGPQRHDQVAEPDEGTVRLREDADNDMRVEDHPRYLLPRHTVVVLLL